MSQNQMFCYQCEQTAKGQGCTVAGVCGKTPDVAALQDLLVYTLRGLGQLSTEAKAAGVRDAETDLFICEALFATLTNVNFDPEAIAAYIRKTAQREEQLRTRLYAIKGKVNSKFNLALEKTTAGLILQGKKYGINSDPVVNSDLHSLQWLLTYGLKGVAAYTFHAALLGKKDDKVFDFINQGLAAPLDTALGVNDFVTLVFKCGEINVRAMELLDAGNTETYGHPTPTQVPLGHKKGKAILVSGHDLIDLEAILKQSEGKGITVYTHGEMLPTHGYPGLKKYSHFYGHYGTAWQNQQKEFAQFPGSILMTTNCIQRPVESYTENIFTSGPVGYPGVSHINDRDFSPVIQKALALPGFQEDAVGKTVLVGFGRNAVLSVADKVIASVKSGHIKRFILVGGCDGAKPGRSYYTEFVEKAPKSTIILTLACGKFRFFDKDLGAIDEIPRLLDIGQCNDAYSAVKIAQALAEAFGVSINQLPLSLVLSWYEQKAVAILLSLLYLGIKDIRIGPSLPAFITPGILNVLVEKFNIMPIKTPDEDLKAIMK
ncbi:MAG TPA: hydroxylamine reductase [Candidatus Acidoferrales bacterium]|nr:hydroxylamine reductase [Candidatus Acidoferrales bacterium]